MDPLVKQHVLLLGGILARVELFVEHVGTYSLCSD